MTQLAGLTAGVLANQATKRVSVVQFSAAVAASAQMAAQQAKAKGALFKGRGWMKPSFPGLGRLETMDNRDALALSISP